MTREEAIDRLRKISEKTPIRTNGDDLVAITMAIQALSQEPCSVSVSEKEPNEITEEVTFRIFKNSLKVRWHDFVIYNVEWLKKNWQMEMDIVCGVKPCDDVVSRQDVLEAMCNFCPNYNCNSKCARYIHMTLLPSVTHKSGKWG